MTGGDGGSVNAVVSAAIINFYLHFLCYQNLNSFATMVVGSYCFFVSLHIVRFSSANAFRLAVYAASCLADTFEPYWIHRLSPFAIRPLVQDWIDGIDSKKFRRVHFNVFAWTIRHLSGYVSGHTKYQLASAMD